MRALLSKLLNEAWCDLLLHHNLALTFAFGACLDVIRIIATGTTAVWTDNPPIVGHLEIVADI